MPSRRDFLSFLPAALVGSPRFDAQPRSAVGPTRLDLSPVQAVYQPLQMITVHGTASGHLLVLDGDGETYFEAPVSLPFSFETGGALGTHTVVLLSENREWIGHASFPLDTHTEIREPSGEYQHLLDTLYWTMASDGPVGARRHQGKVYQYWVDWLMDNTNTLKGMRYFWPEVRESFEIFSVTQREDGMIWENHVDRTPPESDWDRRFKYADFSRPADDGYLGLRRAPVENHVEMYFLEALYLTWQTTGDDAWMRQHLDRALRAVRYSTSDPYRWSQKYRLLKRGLTIDTWDFLCASEAALVGGDFMVIDLKKTHFGIFFGDNTGFIAGCRSLAEMLDRAERSSEATEMRALASDMEERLNRVSWNGQFYTHWVAEDPDFRPDLGVDMSKQVSLSNAYSINRGLNREVDQQHAKAILETYQTIRREMPGTSPGEWYSIYPPFPNGFGDEQGLWEYVNGGVLACTAGELARGGFEHGFEAYGADILARVHAIARRHRDFLPGILRGKEPERTVTDFVSLDLRQAANCDTGKGTAQVPGWVDEPGNYLIGFPTGPQSFRGVPFTIAAEEDNGYRVCIGISHAPRYAPAAQLSVHRSCRSFYLLHAGSGPGAPFGKLTLRYEDGSKQVEWIERGVNVNSFWAPEDMEFNNRYGSNRAERMQVAWRGKSEIIANVGVWITSFEPHTPEKSIASMEFESLENGAKWFVIGVTLSNQRAFLPPKTDLSTGMPNNWGAGCVTAALIEGLAGVKDREAGFRSVRISPRWLTAQVLEAEVSVRYPACRGYVAYRIRYEQGKISLQCTGSFDNAVLRVLLPTGQVAHRITRNGSPVALKEEAIESSRYVLVEVDRRGVHGLDIDLASG